MHGSPDGSRLEVRQRWRLVVRRSAGASSLTQREHAQAWEQSIVGAGLPLAWNDAPTPRPRITFGAPLPAGVAGEAELIDVFFAERLPIWHVRNAVRGHLPEGWMLVDLYDVWPAAPPLAGRVIGAEYRIELSFPETADSPIDASVVAAAAQRLMAARELPRERSKGGGTVRYDLRPLVDSIEVERGADPIVVRTRTRFDAERGSGRPEEVLAALADAAGVPLEAAAVVRERLILADDR